MSLIKTGRRDVHAEIFRQDQHDGHDFVSHGDTESAEIYF